MAAKRDYYEILGIGKNAGIQEIKKAYRKLAKKYHPDTNEGNSQAEQKFKEVTEAYTILSVPEKKKLYDRFGHAAFDGSMSGEEPKDNGYHGYKKYYYQTGNTDDIFKDIFGDIFHTDNAESFRTGESFYENSFYGGNTGSRNMRRKGSNVEAEISVSFEEAVFGCDKVFVLKDSHESGGREQRLQIHIPAGIEDGKYVRLRQKGSPGINGGEPGDLLLKVRVAAKEGIKRKGMDVYTTIDIPFTTAVFGGEVVVNTLYGNVLCKIRGGTQSGTKIRLKGKGIVSTRNPKQYGDQYVTVQIQVPRTLSQEAKEKLKAYEEAANQEKIQV